LLQVCPVLDSSEGGYVLHVRRSHTAGVIHADIREELVEFDILLCMCVGAHLDEFDRLLLLSQRLHDSVDAVAGQSVSYRLTLQSDIQRGCRSRAFRLPV
jgi:hypothetical protein